jgi:hypothetical protein
LVISFWNTAPRLVINSPQKRCGKTRFMDVLAGMSLELKGLCIHATG